jgi:hypothetical protein
MCSGVILIFISHLHVFFSVGCFYYVTNHLPDRCAACPSHLILPSSNRIISVMRSVQVVNIHIMYWYIPRTNFT